MYKLHLLFFSLLIVSGMAGFTQQKRIAQAQPAESYSGVTGVTLSLKNCDTFQTKDGSHTYFLRNDMRTDTLTVQLSGNNISGMPNSADIAGLTVAQIQPQGGNFHFAKADYFSIAQQGENNIPPWSASVNQTMPGAAGDNAAVVVPQTVGVYELQASAVSDGKIIYSNKLDIYVLSLELNNVSFSGNSYHAVQQDTSTATYAAPQWTATTSSPVCFEKDARMDVDADFTIIPTPGDSISLQIRASGDEYAEGIEMPAWSAYSSGADLPCYGHSTQLPDHIDALCAPHPLTWRWAASLEHYATYHQCWVDVASSSNPLFVTNGPPQSPPIYTEVYNSCRWAKGQAIDADIISSVWHGLAGLSVMRPDGQQLYYYFNWLTENTADNQLIASTDGQSRAWSTFFINLLRVQHVDVGSQPLIRVTPNGSPAFCINSWTYTPHTQMPAIDGYSYFNLINGSLISGSAPQQKYNWFQTSDADYSKGTACQLPSTPASKPAALFSSHYIVQLGTTYYDPSYGITYASGDDLQARLISGDVDGETVTWNGAALHTYAFKNNHLNGVTLTPLAAAPTGSTEETPDKIMQRDFISGVQYKNNLYTFECPDYNYLDSTDAAGNISRYFFPARCAVSRQGVLNRWHIGYGNLWQICDMKLADNQTTIYRLSKLPLVDLSKYTESTYNELVRHTDSDHDLRPYLSAVLSSSPAYFSPRILPLEDDTLHGKVYYDFLPTSDNSVTLYVCTTLNNAAANQTAQLQIWNNTGHWSDDKQYADGAWTKTAQCDAPFLEPFIATTHAGAVYFITLSGDVYQFNQEKASLDKIWNNTEGPALSCVTDLDSDHTSIYGRDYMFDIPKMAKPVIFNGGVMAILDALSKQVD